MGIQKEVELERIRCSMNYHPTGRRQELCDVAVWKQLPCFRFIIVFLFLSPLLLICMFLPSTSIFIYRGSFL